MKNTSFFLFILLVCIASCKITKPAAQTKQEVTQTQIPVSDAASQEINFSDPATWLLGYFNQTQLTNEPYSIWYNNGYDDYVPKFDVISRLLEINKDNITIKLIMGTWCPDSRREVPRFMKILNIWHFPVTKVTFIGVDNAKQSPVGEYEKLDIERVPTFIVYKNNVEAGRIIETPTTSLEQDMVNILTRNE